MQDSYGIHWFRRDLRIAGNPALRQNWLKHGGRVVGIFCFDHRFLQRPDFSVDRFQFFIETLKSLRDELRAMGSDLLTLDVGPDDAFSEIFKMLTHAKIKLPTTISWNRDYEPFARARDERMQTRFEKDHFEIITARDHLLIEPNELSRPTAAGEHYQIYSPFARRWLEIFRTSSIQQRVEEQRSGLTYLDQLQKDKAKPIFKLSWKELLKTEDLKRDCLSIYAERNAELTKVPIPAAGSLAALQQLDDFADRAKAYGDKRDFPAVDGTSRIAIYLKNGSLNIAQVIARLNLRDYDKKAISGPEKFLSELIWREFYYHILWHHPNVEHEAFISKFRAIQWQNDETLFEAWKAGRTGYPIVDAGMRQLNRTGWMHNRVRMIVASFLTKDLLIDWRWGERYFMERLLDGDLAPNNGGWQWAASTGCDPQPYFRVFNPWLQGEKFDSEGEYIREYIEELRGVPKKELHNPKGNRGTKYPEPIVDHTVQRIRAVQLYSTKK
jgi:deoxyribodipyrimidine photo-lyase